MKGYLIPYKPDKRLAFGNGERLKGPILFVPERGIIFYEASITGDCDGMGFVTVGANSFESQDTFLRMVEEQLEGKVIHGYDGQEYDLSDGVTEIEIPDADFMDIAETANKAYAALNKFRLDAAVLVQDLEERLGRNKFYPV